MLALKIGDVVHYGAHGVCSVCGTEVKQFRDGGRDYYLLRPVGEDSITLFLPADADPDRVKVRSVLTADEIYSLIDAEQSVPAKWIGDSKQRREACGKVIRSGNAAELIRMVKDMYVHQQALPEGKTLPMSDMELMRNAEKLLFNEFRYVLDISKEQVRPFLFGECTVPALN